MDNKKAADYIEKGSSVLGFEFGSTRIKAVLIGPDSKPLASGSYTWENRLVDGIWTYDVDEIWKGAAGCFSDLKENVQNQYGITLTRFAAGGFSGMMHGYIVLDKNGRLLTPFRTWRNNITEEASKELTELFNFPIPQRWSIAHLYQAVLNGEKHVEHIDFITTLAGYVHYKLTGEGVLGTGEASGMFPVDPATGDYDAAMIDKFDRLTAEKGYPWKLREILPGILPAGRSAGNLSKEKAALLDPSGDLEGDIPFCPPEGDAGTGMIATNSIRERTGNVSAGTSVFAMIVLEKKLSAVHPEIDLVLTPDGKLVGMAHSNNCTSDIDAWISLFGQAAEVLGFKASADDLYGKLLPLALKGDKDAGGMLSYGYVSGEHMTGFHEGRPLFVRRPETELRLDNFLRSHLFGSLCALRTGLDILIKREGVAVDEIRGHGGFFKTPDVGQRIMAAATRVPVSLIDTAGEGGAWGMALLAAYLVQRGDKENLAGYLDKIFEKSMGTAMQPDPGDVEGFDRYFERYHRGLTIEREAVNTFTL